MRGRSKSEGSDDGQDYLAGSVVEESEVEAEDEIEQPLQLGAGEVLTARTFNSQVPDSRVRATATVGGQELTLIADSGSVASICSERDAKRIGLVKAARGPSAKVGRKE
eukprot:Blabericola_migrator_1__978@NODE_1244_length_5004_cov_49_974681_g841_i0_p2_GENE_NODE_1244_length_5004_cov_49_974681_g841_i0NODE_1244_length_5004_cov_49_974681_g841_i0_p2_ORF_typecomplete_len109_score12_97gagasp_proteas/PF13975_6/0_00084Asp_protease_2/PF13650_6/5_3e03Asp_protease_2/PF13650_6/0_0018Asp_protease/PF09668_10/0_019_NODE_1244_length_5004_cov_49_974681_g841_i0614940